MNFLPCTAQNRSPHRAPVGQSVGQGPSGPGWLAIAFGFWSGRALATGTAWAGLCLIHHHHPHCPEPPQKKNRKNAAVRFVLVRASC